MTCLCSRNVLQQVPIRYDDISHIPFIQVHIINFIVRSLTKYHINYYFIYWNKFSRGVYFGVYCLVFKINSLVLYLCHRMFSRHSYLLSQPSVLTTSQSVPGLEGQYIGTFINLFMLFYRLNNHTTIVIVLSMYKKKHKLLFTRIA